MAVQHLQRVVTRGLRDQLPFQLARTHPTLLAKNIRQIKLVVLLHRLDHLLSYATKLLTPAANYVKKQSYISYVKVRDKSKCY